MDPITYNTFKEELLRDHETYLRNVHRGQVINKMLEEKTIHFDSLTQQNKLCYHLFLDQVVHMESDDDYTV